MCHLKKGFLKEGDQVCVRIESDQGLRVAKVTRLLEMLGYTIAQTRKGMKHLRLTLLRSKKLIQAAKITLFTCVLRYHMISLEDKGQNLIVSNSVAGA